MLVLVFDLRVTGTRHRCSQSGDEFQVKRSLVGIELVFCNGKPVVKREGSSKIYFFKKSESLQYQDSFRFRGQ